MEKEIILPEDAEIGIRIPINTIKGHIEIEIIADGKSYGGGKIPEGCTGDFSFGTLKCPKSKKGIIFKPSFNFSLFGSGISLGSD